MSHDPTVDIRAVHPSSNGGTRPAFEVLAAPAGPLARLTVAFAVGLAGLAALVIALGACVQ